MLAFDGDTFPFIGLACVQVKQGRCSYLWLFFLRSFLLILFFVFLFFSIRVLSFYAYYPLCMYVFTYIYLLLVSYDLLFSRGYFTSSVSFTFALFRHLYSWYFIYSVFLNIFKSNFFSSFKTFVSSVLLGNEIDIYCKILMFWHYLQHFLKRFSRFIHYLMRNSFPNIKFLPR